MSPEAVGSAGSPRDFPAAQQLFFVCTFRGGLVIRQEMLSSKAEALEAAGLSEQAMFHGGAERGVGGLD